MPKLTPKQKEKRLEKVSQMREKLFKAIENYDCVAIHKLLSDKDAAIDLFMSKNDQGWIPLVCAFTPSKAPGFIKFLLFCYEKLGILERAVYTRTNNKDTVIAMAIMNSNSLVAQTVGLFHPSADHHWGLLSQKNKDGVSAYMLAKQRPDDYGATHTEQNNNIGWYFYIIKMCHEDGEFLEELGDIEFQRLDELSEEEETKLQEAKNDFRKWEEEYVGDELEFSDVDDDADDDDDEDQQDGNKNKKQPKKKEEVKRVAKKTVERKTKKTPIVKKKKEEKTVVKKKTSTTKKNASKKTATTTTKKTVAKKTAKKATPKKNAGKSQTKKSKK